MTGLGFAIKQNNLQKVKQIIKFKKTYPDILDEKFYLYEDYQDEVTPLIYALSLRHTDIARELIQNGADITLTDDSGSTPLIAAIGIGNRQIVDILIEKGADVNKPDYYGRTPLMIAVEKDSDGDITRALLNAGADMDARDREGRLAQDIVWTPNISQILKKKRAGMPLVQKQKDQPIATGGGGGAAIDRRQQMRTKMKQLIDQMVDLPIGQDILDGILQRLKQQKQRLLQQHKTKS